MTRLLFIAFVAFLAGMASAERYAVLVGINDYQFVGMRDLRYAEDDARLMRDALVNLVGVPEANVRLLLGSDATREAIGQAITGWLAERARPDDTALFYFAGHGGQLLDDDRDEADGLDECLWAWDSALLDITLVRDDDLNRWLAAVPASRPVVVLDCCHSGTGSRYLGDNAMRAANVDPASVALSPVEKQAATEIRLRRSGTSGTTSVPVFRLDTYLSELPRANPLELSGCRPEQVVVEASQLGHGALTYFAVEGLRGVADADGDGKVTLRELRDYAARRIGEYGFDQDPQLIGEGSETYALVAPPHLVASLPPSVAASTPNDHTARTHRDDVVSVAVVGDDADVVRRVEDAFARNPRVVVALDARADRLCFVSREEDSARLELANPVNGSREATTSVAMTALDTMMPFVDALDVALAYKSLASLSHPSSPLRLRLDAAERVAVGERVTIEVTPNRDGHLVVVNLTPDGSLYVLFPNAFRPNTGVRGNEPVRIPDASWEIVAEGPAGTEMVKAVFTTEPVRFDLPEGADALSASESGVAIRRLLDRLRAMSSDAWATAAVPIRVVTGPMEAH
jgi:uncharacterized caspase-like protein